MSASCSAMDDPTACGKLLVDVQMPSILIEHVVGLGFTTMALLAHAVSDRDQVEDLTKHLSLIPAGEEFQPFSPQTASIRRAIKEPMAVAMESGRPSQPERQQLSVQRAKLSPAEVKELKDQFCANYPGDIFGLPVLCQRGFGFQDSVVDPMEA